MKWEDTLEFKHSTIHFCGWYCITAEQKLLVYFNFAFIVFLLLIAVLSCTLGPPVLCFSIELFNKTRQLLVPLLDVIQQPRLIVHSSFIFVAIFFLVTTFYYYFPLIFCFAIELFSKTTIGPTVGRYTAAATACRGRERAALQHQRRFYFNEREMFEQKVIEPEKCLKILLYHFFTVAYFL